MTSKSVGMKKITDPEEKQVLAIKMKKVEEALHITAKELARKCGVSDDTIYRIEGRTKSDAAISEKTILIICEKTGVNAAWMLDYSTPASEPIFSSVKEKQNDETPGDRVRILRTEQSMSQRDFSDLVGTSYGNLGAIETGRNKLTVQMAKKIEERFEHGGAEWLLTGNERNRHYPLGDEMIEWLKNHQEERERIWKMMRGGG